jgi:hypothetical protein
VPAGSRPGRPRPTRGAAATRVVPGAGLLEVAGTAHLAGVERPESVTAALLTHFTAGTDATAQRAHDDAALATAQRRLFDEIDSPSDPGPGS